MTIKISACGILIKLSCRNEGERDMDRQMGGEKKHMHEIRGEEESHQASSTGSLAL